MNSYFNQQHPLRQISSWMASNAAIECNTLIKLEMTWCWRSSQEEGLGLDPCACMNLK